MKIVETYSHLNGFEWMMYHRKALWEEIETAVEAIDAEKYRTKVSKEKTMKGKKLFSPIEINGAFKNELEKEGWAESRTSYWVTKDAKLIRKTLHLPQDEQKQIIADAGLDPIRSYNQTDFQKDRVAIEVQFGKYSFIAYDLFVKHMAFFVGDKIDVGIEVLPMKSMQSQMSSGPGYYEGALYDLVRQGRGVPAVPLIIVGIE
ncbi:BglII/BstYI family type II restriction endonuclease [Pseudodesulfovibrio senegalensis]|uniref:Restriction endonuclease n=1 Tax=Pseudodesulfovibrio senegalensis TaxID=1721087 RepID=A0A6N6N7T2_9BACT|nr:BglII/BstYI family type II restriction endonuclease [Pseudodesulfovibrio senegalensis]KAB1443741.1 restriction endonuclease [Pseudodesulfovibrio senegalensis]